MCPRCFSRKAILVDEKDDVPRLLMHENIKDLKHAFRQEFPNTLVLGDDEKALIRSGSQSQSGLVVAHATVRARFPDTVRAPGTFVNGIGT